MEDREEIDDYAVLKELGVGVNSVVKLVRSVIDNRLYALKLVKDERKELTGLHKLSLSNECKVLQELEHPNIVRLVELKCDGHYKARNGVTKT
jgi:serine/threonine protein kinase